MNSSQCEFVPVILRREPKRSPGQMNDAGLNCRERPVVAYYFRQSTQSVTHEKEHVSGASIANVSEHGHWGT